jgi:hypothetical protein
VTLALLEEVLYHIHNWFIRSQWRVSECAISEGALPEAAASAIPQGAFYRVEGSLLNDGLHRMGEDALEDETFSGRISLCVIPKALLSVVEEIEAWQEKYGEQVDGPLKSESFGGYKYTLKTAFDYGLGYGAQPQGGWRLAFRDRLNPFRKMWG